MSFKGIWQPFTNTSSFDKSVYYIQAIQNKMTHLSLILFNFNFLLPVVLIGTLSLTIASFYKVKTRRQSLYNLISIHYRRILTEKYISKITDGSLTFYFCSLLFVKLCVRIFIVYISSK